MNLTTLDSQTELVVQGQTPEETEKLLELAATGDLPVMDSDEGRDFMLSSVSRPGLGKALAGGAFNLLVDGPSGEGNEFHWGLRSSHSKVGTHEEKNFLQVVRAAGSSRLASSPEQERQRLFEKPE